MLCSILVFCRFPPPRGCLSDLDVHIAYESDDTTIRVGPTETLNLNRAKTDNFNFHPANSPFTTTTVLTTYSKFTTSTPGCTVTAVYDDKIPPRGGFHTGAASLTMSAGCGEGTCVDIEFLDPAYNAAGKCRFRYHSECA